MEDGRINPFTLAFRSRPLETEYWNRYLPRMRQRTVLAVTIVLVIYTAFGFLDVWIVPEAVTEIWTIRAFVFVLCIILILLTGTRLFERRHQLIILSLPLLGGLGLLLMMALAGETGRLLYYAGLILAIFWVMLLADLKFPLGLAACFYLIAGYEIIVLYLRPMPLPVVANNTFFLIGALMMAVSAGYTIKLTMRVNFYQSLVIEHERKRSEGLLLNILPREITEVLKDHPGTIAERFEKSSILFADIVGFTTMSARMTAEEMVTLLNEVFSFFDSLVDKYRLEKIRTIGDNYMVASGVPRPRPDHAQALARMALEMRDYVRDSGKAADGFLNFRIGINSGPVVAGVIGYRKFQYDVWGDAVNTASRMESHGVPGEIQITRATYELLKDEFICRPRGMIEVKGMGRMETLFLVEGKPQAAQPPPGPN